jgi:cardiolipin synthase A/B
MSVAAKAKEVKEKVRPKKPVRVIELPFWLGVVLALLVVLLALMLWSSKREHEAKVRVPDIANLEEALPSIAAATKSQVVAGNAVEVLQDGAFFPAFLADVAAARETVHLETYVWWEGEICARVAEALAAKARQGIEVRLLVDAVGAKKMDERLVERMLAVGVQVHRYHPFSLKEIGVFNNRTHRKVAVIDGRTAHVFGHGIAREWIGKAQDAEHWRDTGVRLRGPIVSGAQAVFAENWTETTAEVLVGEKYFPQLARAGPVRAHVASSSPSGGVSTLELLFEMAIASAQEKLLIQNPYFIPDEEVVRLLARAVARGVEVRIMLPGPVTDSAVVKHAGHFYWDRLLAAGVEIYEYRKTLNHQKVLVVDGVWSFVGSTNLDDRSLDINDELSVGMLDEATARRLEAAWDRDVRDCARIEAGAWERRSLWHKAQDGLSYALNGQL